MTKYYPKDIREFIALVKAGLDVTVTISDEDGIGHDLSVRFIGNEYHVSDKLFGGTEIFTERELASGYGTGNPEEMDRVDSDIALAILRGRLSIEIPEKSDS